MAVLAANIETERARLRMSLDRLRRIRAAEALEDRQAVERRLERAAEIQIRRELSRGSVIAATSAADRRHLRERAVIARRDALTRAGNYPMTEQELAEISWHATLAAKVPEDAREDIAQDVAEWIHKRHGKTPLRADVTRAGLRKIAQALYLAKRRKDERATGARLAAEQLAEWRRGDHRNGRAAAMAEVARGGDGVRALAEGRPMLDPPPVEDAQTLARRLPWLSDGMRSALAVALHDGALVRAHRAPVMTGTERVQWANARRAILTRCPDESALRRALRPVEYSARLLVDAAIRVERRRAALRSRGAYEPKRLPA